MAGARPTRCVVRSSRVAALALERQVVVSRPLVPRADVVARVVAERPQHLRRDRRARAAVAIRDTSLPASMPSAASIWFELELHQPVDLDVPRTGDVPLPRVARLAERPVVFLHRAHVDIATSPSRPRSSSIAISVIRARRSRPRPRSTGAARARPSQARSARAARRRAGRARGSPTARMRHLRRGSARPRAASSRACQIVVVAAAERVVVVAEKVVEAMHEQPSPRALARASAGSSAGSGIALLEVRHDHLRLRQDEAKPSSSTGTRPRGGFSSIDPARAVTQVDLDRLVVDALLGERDPRTRAVRAASSVDQLHGSSPISRAICSNSSAAGGSSAGVAAVRAMRRTSSREAPVRPRRRASGWRRARVRRLSGARRTRSAPTGTRRPSGRARRCRKRTTSPSSASAIVTAPSRSESSRAKRPCASRSRSKHRVGDADPAVVGANVGVLEPGDELRRRRARRDTSSSLCTWVIARASPASSAPRAARRALERGRHGSTRTPRSRDATRRREPPRSTCSTSRLTMLSRRVLRACRTHSREQRLRNALPAGARLDVDERGRAPVPRDGASTRATPTGRLRSSSARKTPPVSHVVERVLPLVRPKSPAPPTGNGTSARTPPRTRAGSARRPRSHGGSSRLRQHSRSGGSAQQRFWNGSRRAAELGHMDTVETPGQPCAARGRPRATRAGGRDGGRGTTRPSTGRAHAAR